MRTSLLAAEPIWPRLKALLGSWRQARTLVMGSAAAQGLGVLALPLLARQYTPEAFGAMGTILALAMLLLAGIGLKYELAIVTERRPARAEAALLLVLLVTAGTALFLFVLIALAYTPLVRALGLGAHGWMLLPLPLLVWLMGWNHAWTFWLTRRGDWRAQATFEVGRQGSLLSGQIGLGLLTSGPAGLLLGRCLGELLGLVAVLRHVHRDEPVLRRRGPALRWRMLMALARRHWRLPALQTPRALIGALAMNLPALVLAWLGALPAVGLYWFAARLMRLPLGLVGNAVRRVFLREVVALRAAGQGIRGPFLRATGLLVGGAAGPVLLIVLIGPDLFALLFGEPWREAGAIARWLALWSWAELAAAPAGMLVVLLAVQGSVLVGDLAAAAAGCLGLAWAVATGRLELGIALYAAAMALRCLWSIGLLWWRLAAEEPS